MTVPARIPDDEAERLETLRRFAVLDTPPEECFDRIVHLAARHFQVSTALVSLVDENRQWFKAKCGLDAGQTERNVAFCAHAILSNDVFVIPDAQEDPRFRDNPLVTGGPKIRFYAGAPLTAANGQNVGTLCLVDQAPRPPLTELEKLFLKDLAAIVADELEMRSATGNVLSEVQTRIAAEHRLEATERQLRLFIEYAPAAIAMFDNNMIYLAASRRWSEEYNLEDENIVGRSHYDVFPEIPERWKSDHERCLRGEVLESDEDQFERADGSVDWLRWALHPWLDSQGHIGGLIMFTEVITQRKQAADELERNQEFLNAILENVQDGIIACDAEGRVSIVNSATRRFYGLNNALESLEEWVPDYELYEPDGETLLSREHNPLFRALAGDTFHNSEMVIVAKDQPPRHLVAGGLPLFDAQGIKIGAVASMHDVSGQKQMAAQYHQAQKMEAVGQLTGGLAHDFNNLLAVILGNLQLLQRALKDDEKSARRAAAAEDAAQRGAELTKRLLAFSRKQTLEPSIVDTNKLISGMEDLLRRTLGEMIDLKIVHHEDAWSVRTDENQLEAAILNLSINARDAMEGNGHLTIETKNMLLDKDYTENHAELLPGKYVAISISDNGCGMSEEVISRVFEPFFTTKEVGKGSGLGLSMVYGFIQQSGGHVNIYSELGHGTTITMYLPETSGDEMEYEADVLMSPEEEVGSESILVVEDSDAVREVVVAMLEDMGYVMTEASDGNEALEILDKYDGNFDLLFTDIVMPGGLNGTQLAKIVKERFPHVKILYTSGYAEAAVLREGEVEAQTNLVSKPFRREDLSTKIRKLLREPVDRARLA